MRVRIHRGSHEIGGNCVEIAADDGSRIVLDLGRPLTAGWDDDVELPDVPGLRERDPSLLGIVVSHPHLDHWGLLGQLDTDVPVFIGEEAERILRAAEFFNTSTPPASVMGHLHHRETFTLGPFTVTPFLNDHSAFDAYSLLIEADGRRLFYTGDIRAHGRKGSLFEQLVGDPPADIDAMLMEGTHVRSNPGDDDATFQTESDLELQLAALAVEAEGALVVFGSAQNLDRVVTVFRAAKRSGRTFVTDLYGATVAAATRETIPQPGFDDYAVYVPNRQRILVKKSEEFERVEWVKPWRMFHEQLAADPGQWIFYIPSSTAPELVKHGVLDEAGIAIWSLWDGYLKEPSGERLQQLLDEHHVPLIHVHTSGHASVTDLKRLVNALDPDAVVPIHSEAGDRYEELFPRVERRADGEWWMVGGTGQLTTRAGDDEGFVPGAPTAELASWWVMAQLLARAEGDFRVIETHPGGGQYDCLSLIGAVDSNPTTLLDLNRTGAAHATALGFGSHRRLDLFWRDLVQSEDPHALIDELRDLLQLRERVGPPSVHGRVVRAISEFLHRRAGIGERWTCRNGVFDRSLGSEVRRELFERFPEADRRRSQDDRGDLLGIPEYRFWFLMKDAEHWTHLPADSARVCIEITGEYWAATGSQGVIASNPAEPWLPLREGD